MKKFMILCVYILIILSLVGCKGDVITDKDILGTWVSSDGATIYFYEDKTFVLTQLKGDVISELNPFLPELEEYNATGDWELSEMQGWNVIF